MKPNSFRARTFPKLILSGTLFLFAQSHPAKSQPATPQTPNSQAVEVQNKTVNEFVDRLKSQNEDARRLAFESLSRSQRNLNLSVMRLLGELKKNPDHSFGSSFHMTLRVVSALNIREAVVSLGDMIDFQLDPATMPVGGRGGERAYYPVAQTVIDLNDSKKTIEIVMHRFDSEVSDTTLRAYTHVLQEVLGEKIAKFVVQSNLDRAEKQMVLMPNAIGVQTQRDNLIAALKLLDEGGVIIRVPSGQVRDGDIMSAEAEEKLAE